MPGWLGANTPEAMAGGLMFRGEELPCHSSIDYARRDWFEAWTEGKRGRRCVGSLIMLVNHAKLPRDSDYAAACSKVDADAEHVFGHIKEFVTHHRNAATRSWETGAE